MLLSPTRQRGEGAWEGTGLAGNKVASTSDRYVHRRASSWLDESSAILNGALLSFENRFQGIRRVHDVSALSLPPCACDPITYRHMYDLFTRTRNRSYAHDRTPSSARESVQAQPIPPRCAVSGDWSPRDPPHSVWSTVRVPTHR